MSSASRNVVRLADWLPSFYVVGIILILVSGKDQCLVVLGAGETVVREVRASQELPGASPVAEPELSGELGGWDVRASPAAEVVTVRSFLERRYEIAPAARSEIASTLAAKLRPRVVGAPEELDSEAFLQALYAVKRARS